MPLFLPAAQIFLRKNPLPQPISRTIFSRTSYRSISRAASVWMKL